MIAHAVRLYLRFALSFRDVEELLTERGVQVSYETVRRWVAKFGAHYAEELRRRERRAGRTWHLDEMSMRVGGRRPWLGRAVDEHGPTFHVLVQKRRDTVAAERFFRRLLSVSDGVAPARITTDKLGSYATALVRFPELAGVQHEQVRSPRRCNNRVEQAHQPTRIRERIMRRLRTPSKRLRGVNVTEPAHPSPHPPPARATVADSARAPRTPLRPTPGP